MFLIRALTLLALLAASCAEPEADPAAEADAAPDLPAEEIIDQAPDAAPQPGKPLGATCQRDDQCLSGLCWLDPVWPSGHCALSGCGAECDAAGGVCLPIKGGEQVCAKYCATRSDCRFGYSCHRDRTTLDTGCLPTPLVPEPPVVIPPPGRTPDGGACEFDGDCMSDTCLTGDVWPSGFCTTQPCGTQLPCHVAPDGPNTVCAHFTALGEDLCRVTCSSDAECRQGYSCADFDGVNRYCVPPIARPSVSVLPFDIDTYPLPIQCAPVFEPQTTITYTLDAQQTHHSLVVFSPGGFKVEITRLQTPVATLPLRAYGFALEIARLYHGWLQTLILPSLPHYRSSFEPGDYTVTVATLDGQVCWYVLGHPGGGRNIEINIYLPGQPDITELTQDAALVDLIDHINDALAPHSLHITARVRPLPEQAHAELSYVRRSSDFLKLSAHTSASLDGAASPLSVNLILVKGFADPNLLGRSQGLPGPPGIHGTSISAVFATQPTSQDVSSLAHTVIHEVGHYLGLRHTSERDGATVDPLNDTPRCAYVYSDPYSCPDRANLMFPFNMGYSSFTISPDQLSQLRSNPLVQP